MEEEFSFPPEKGKEAAWMAHFYPKFKTVYATYDVTKPEFDLFEADALVFAFVNGRRNKYGEASLLFFTDEEVLWFGDPENPNLNSVTLTDQVAVVGEVPPTVAPNIYQRVKSIVMRLRVHPKMTEAVAKWLGIQVKPKPAPQPKDEFTPVLKAKVQNGVIILNCPLNGFAGYEIWRDNQGGMNFTNGHTSVSRFWEDHLPLPEGMQTQLRSFRVRMLIAGNKPIGNFSNMVQATAVRMNG
jgi:hypothetical protein